jgi:CO/xanthine dehydrogenase FAD-binding subunit
VSVDRIVPLVYYPTSLGEALSLFAANPNSQLVAGGTSFLAYPHEEYIPFNRIIINLCEATDLKRIIIRERYVDIGPMITLGDLAKQGRIFLPEVMKDALAHLGNYSLRNQATLGGNLVQGNGRGDLLPVLLVLGAQIELRSYRSTRWTDIRDWINPENPLPGPREILSRIRIPTLPWNYAFYQKLGKFQNPPSLRGSITLNAIIEKAIIDQINLALLTPATGTIRNRNWEAILTGQRLPLSRRDRSNAFDQFEADLQDTPGHSPTHPAAILLPFLPHSGQIGQSRLPSGLTQTKFLPILKEIPSPKSGPKRGER